MAIEAVRVRMMIMIRMRILGQDDTNIVIMIRMRILGPNELHPINCHA